MRALITGITGNVGRATACLLRNNGWQVVGIARGECNEEGIETHPLDLTNEGDVIGFVLQQEPFDLVVMAHGTQRQTFLGANDFMDWYEQVVATNLTGAVILTNELIAWDRLNYGSLVVYCGSIQAAQTRAGRLPYAVAKAGLEGLARGVAVELAPRARAVCLRLGQLDSTMAGVVFSSTQVAEIERRLLAPLVPCQDVAKFIMTLYEQGSITGAVIDVDSGHSLSIWPVQEIDD